MLAAKDERRPPRDRLLPMLLTMLVAIGPVSTDLYLPSLPGIARDLAAAPALVQLTLGVFIGTLAVMQLVYGPIADRFGRRPVLLGATSLYVAASVLCALAPSIALLLVARVIQAVGASAGSVVGRAVVRDIWGPRDSARILSYMASAMAIAPLIGPFLGGVLEVTLGWRANFVLLALYGLALVLALGRRLPETMPELAPGVDPARMLQGYAMLLRHPLYRGFVACNAFAFAGLFTWISTSSFVVIEHFAVPPQHFAWVFGAAVGGFAVGAFAGGRLGSRLGGVRTVGAGAFAGAIGGGVMMAASLTGLASLTLVTVTIAVFFVGCGLVLPQAMAGALAPFPRIAGTAAAFLGFAQMMAGLLANVLAGVMFDDSERPMAVLIGLSSLGMLAAFVFLVRPRWQVETGAEHRGDGG